MLRDVRPYEADLHASMDSMLREAGDYFVGKGRHLWRKGAHDFYSDCGPARPLS